MCVRMCMGERGTEMRRGKCECVCQCLHVGINACVSVCMRACSMHTPGSLCVCVHAYSLYVCVCVCVCLGVMARSGWHRPSSNQKGGSSALCWSPVMWAPSSEQRGAQARHRV